METEMNKRDRIYRALNSNFKNLTQREQAIMMNKMVKDLDACAFANGPSFASVVLDEVCKNLKMESWLVNPFMAWKCIYHKSSREADMRLSRKNDVCGLIKEACSALR